MPRLNPQTMQDTSLSEMSDDASAMGWNDYEMTDDEAQEAARGHGISAKEAEDVNEALARGEISYQDIFNLSHHEMAAMAWRAEELLRTQRPKDALKIFLALHRLNRFEHSYIRGAGLCFHHLQEFGMALGAYDLALATRPDDWSSEALRAECLLRLDGRHTAIAALRTVLGHGPARNATEAHYLERAKAFLQRLDPKP